VSAIAANITLGVVEPMMNGMGGDLFAIEWDARTGAITGLDDGRSRILDFGDWDAVGASGGGRRRGQCGSVSSTAR